MGLALYRKYRPKKLSDVVGQDVIIDTLKNALASKKASHAYLLTGPRGVGKTTIARILAHELNELPYSDESIHLDIIEIDAASNRRIDEIRDLRDKIHVAPTSAKYKVYIIDEVHMLTREAFNALLKTLEEPPAHAVFILATTEAHKVPDTIVSRTQRFTFKAITKPDMVRHLAHIAKQESIDITPDALEVLASHSGGSFRDSLNLLDQLASSGSQITPDSIEKSLGIPNYALVDSLYASAMSQNHFTVLEAVHAARLDGAAAPTLAKLLSEKIRTNIAEKSVPITDKILLLLEDLTTLSTKPDQYMHLEIALLRYCTEATAAAAPSQQPAAPVTTSAPIVAPIKQEPQKTLVPVAAEPATVAESVNEPAPAPQHKPAPTPEPAQQPTTPPKNVQSTEDYWVALLTTIKSKHNTIYSILRMAVPELTEDTLTLTFKFAFHQKQISQANTIQHIAEAIQEITGAPRQIICVLGSIEPKPPTIATQPKKADAPQPSATDPTLTDVSSIFAGAEILE